jgi:hypothetical protein
MDANPTTSRDWFSRILSLAAVTLSAASFYLAYLDRLAKSEHIGFEVNKTYPVGPAGLRQISMPGFPFHLKTQWEVIATNLSDRLISVTSYQIGERWETRGISIDVENRLVGADKQIPFSLPPGE